jgi:polyisoprenoid-binding protein YceI
MSTRYRAHTLAGCTTAALLLASAMTPAAAQSPARAPLAVDSARITISGTSNVHAYTAATTNVRLTGAQVASTVAGPDFWTLVTKPGGLEGFEVTIAAATLSSPKEGLDKNMHKALKVTEHPDITFRLMRLEAGAAPGSLQAVGVLRIAGVTREVTLPIETALTAETLKVTGELPLLMTDYGITPPKAMLGMLKTDPKVVVTFEVTLSERSAPSTAAFASGPSAEDPPAEEPKKTPNAAPADTDEDADVASALDAWKKGRQIPLQYYRAQDQRGINVFETTKDPGAEFKGVRIDFGAAFTSQVQNLVHRNTAAPVVVGGVNTNQLQNIGFGFNNSTANLYLNAQLAPGVRVALTSYLSARHHNETWVKDGYIQIDESPLDIVPLKALMQIITLRVGHFEINYGDAHFRRSDNGNALYNPFVGNYILDAFTTEIGAEAYLKTKGIIAMASVTGGEIRGTVVTPGQRGPAFIGKLGVDRQVKKDLRVRLTGSMYRADKAMSSTLYGGDRAGSRYYWVMENTAATESAQFTSGLINPGFKNKVTAMQVNPFVKFRGLEVFGVIEKAEGMASTEVTERTFKQYAVDTVYRFLPDEKLFVGVRYNKAYGELPGITGDAGANRWQIGGGWFIMPGLLAKVEYVDQKYFGYPAANIKNGGRFRGVMLEGVVAF